MMTYLLLCKKSVRRVLTLFLFMDRLLLMPGLELLHLTGHLVKLYHRIFEI